MKPFEYQEAGLQALKQSQEQGNKKGLVIMPSGMGKTALVAFAFQRWRARHPEAKGLYLCHQNDILAQAQETFDVVCGSECSFGFFTGIEKTKHSTDMLFASFQTMKSYKEQFSADAFDFIIVDESHHAAAKTYKEVIDYFQTRFLLGVTATPERGDLQDIQTIFGETTFEITLEEAIAKYWLAGIEYRLVLDNIETELQALKLSDAVKRQTVADLNKNIFIPKRDEEIIRIIRRNMSEIKNPKVLIFCQSVKHAKRIYNLMPEAELVFSATQKIERKESISHFREGDGEVIISVDLFNEGIDFPEANLVVFWRSTSSLRIFLQQLGRGLRKTKQKHRVRILDFVGNVERIEILAQLTSRFDKAGANKNALFSAYEESAKNNGDVELKVSSGSVQFTEYLENIIEYLTFLRRGYTRSILLKLLKEFARELGRTPSQKDVIEAASRGEMPSIAPFTRVFGSWVDTLKAAGLDNENTVTPPKYTEAELIQKLQELGKTLGRTPTCLDIRERARTTFPSLSTFLSRFGTWLDALEKAGFEQDSPLGETEAEIIVQLQSLGQSLGRVPVATDVENAARLRICTNMKKIANIFGSFPKALKAAGLTPSREHFSDAQLIQQIKMMHNELGRIPTKKDVEKYSKAKKTGSERAFKGHFGSWRKALKKAGFKERAIVSHR